MRPRDPRAAAAPLALLALLALLAAELRAQRCASGDEDQGLPKPDAAWAPYHEDPEHALNRIFRAIWLAELAPAEISSALPRERGERPLSFEVGWVHEKRAGTARDAKLFGGDGRQLPREGFSAEESERLLAALVALGEKERESLLAPPELAVLFQHDLLRLAQRLLETEQNPELVPPLARAARWCALDAGELARLRDPLSRALASPHVRGELERAGAQGLASLAEPGSTYREVLRRSTRLFDAERTLTWSRVYLAHPEGTGALEAMLAETRERGARPSVPIGFRGILVQGIVALSEDGSPCATPLIVEARIQHLVNRGDLARTNASFTKDGIDFAIVQLQREGLRRGEPERFYRFVEPDDQELFRDYGTLKHATYRAQCSLCHRNSGTPEPELGGFPVLRPSAQPALATSGTERLRLAESEMLHFLAQLPNVRGAPSPR